MRRPKELPRRQKIQSATMSTDAADRLVGTIVERLRQLQGDGADATSATLKEIFKTSRPAIIADRLMKAAGDLAQGNEGALQVKLSELALEIRRKVIGPKTLSAAKSLDLLVDAMSRTKQFGAAIPLCTEALPRQAALGSRAKPMSPWRTRIPAGKLPCGKVFACSRACGSAAGTRSK